MTEAQRTLDKMVLFSQTVFNKTKNCIEKNNTMPFIDKMTIDIIVTKDAKIALKKNKKKKAIHKYLSGFYTLNTDAVFQKLPEELSVAGFFCIKLFSNRIFTKKSFVKKAEKVFDLVTEFNIKNIEDIINYFYGGKDTCYIFAKE